MRGSGRGNLREASAQNNRARILPHNLPAIPSANLPTGWWRRRPERRSFVFDWRSLKRPSLRCGRNWQKSDAGGKRPSGSAMTYVENCTPSGSRENGLRRLWRSRKGQRSRAPARGRLRRAHRDHRDPGGAGYSVAELLLIGLLGSPHPHCPGPTSMCVSIIRLGGRCPLESPEPIGPGRSHTYRTSC